MRTKLAAVLLAGALTPLPPAPFATTSRQPGVSLGMGQAAATHATRGVVKSIDGTMLVIIRFARRGELTFSLLPSTKREGAIVVGSTV